MLITHEQTQLLRAALLDGEAARSAFTAWLPRAAGPLDRGSRRLLPLLHLNLRALGMAYATKPRLVEAWQSAAVQNAALIEMAAAVVNAFRAAGIECVVLKGIALAVHVYPDIAARPMDDCDLLVRADQALRARDVLLQNGFRSDVALDESVLATVHAVRFVAPSGLFLDLHWHVSPESCEEQADREQWAAVEPLEVGGARAWTLGPADMLLHVCVHGLRWSTTPPVRWAADALFVIRKAGSRLDWARVVDRAAQQRVVLPMLNAVRFLREHLDAPVPGNVFERLSRMRVSRSDAIEYRVKVRPRTSAQLMLLHWFQHRRRARASLFGDLLRFPRYLSRVWGLRPRLR